MSVLPWELAPHLPWRMFTGPLEQWERLPTFLIGETVIIACAVATLFHARRAGSANLLIWFAALVAGTGNDLIFMALPLVDNFWQAQASIMLTPRLPLYIVCMYLVFMYWPTVAVRGLGLGRWSTATLTGLVACMLYAPYDIVGAKFLWWTWHDGDGVIAARVLGAPASSSLWVLTFVGAFALLLDMVLRKREVTGKTAAIGLALVACLTTPIMMVQMTVLQTIDGGVPGYLALGIGLTGYAAAAWLGLRAANWRRRRVDWLGLGAVGAYLFMLVFNMTLFAPETHVSIGVHQLPGACDVLDTDITGVTRRKFLCVDDYEEDFTFDCTTLPADGTQWYTICGRPHTNYAVYATAVGGLSLGGVLVFSLLFGAMGGARRAEGLAEAVPGSKSRT